MFLNSTLCQDGIILKNACQFFRGKPRKLFSALLAALKKMSGSKTNGEGKDRHCNLSFELLFSIIVRCYPCAKWVT